VGVAVTATWSHRRSLVAAALGRRTLPTPAAVLPPAVKAPRSAPAHSANAVFTGLGFDACSTPSSSDMSAWGSSPYRALNIYIGGVNSACAQPNLTSTWVANEVASGWRLIPTYVGLQAPSNTCGCGSISPSQASAEGTAAATDAVNDAQAVAIPAGNPIYFDMEGYNRGGSNTSSVMAFLSAWTSRLHALGYLSGVYSSGASGMTDLANAYGTSYIEPDDIWFAEWNGSQSTASGYVPAAYWSNHQRIHQYRGGHNETYGGVTINIDGDYLDGATAADTSAVASGAPPLPDTPPSLGVSPTTTGVTNFSASWSGAGGVTAWRVLGGETSAAMGGIGSARVSGAVTQIAIRSSAPYFALQALGSGNQVLGTSPAVATPPHLAIYGKSAFLPAVNGGVGGLPVGCYTGQSCQVSTTISIGPTVVGRTGPENIGSGNAGIVYFRLNSTGTRLLLRARSRRLPVQFSVIDGPSGQAATSPITLVPFSTTGRVPVSQLTRSPTLKIVGLTHFVYGGVGGILAGCMGTPICGVTTTLSVGRTVIARTGSEIIGTDELGYLIFRLTPRGRSMLARAPGNSLPARVSLSTGTANATAPATATANISLVRYR
jgi:hypothetical protein